MIGNGNGRLQRTPKCSALIWRYLPPAQGRDGDRIGVLLPYGTSYFRFFQLFLSDYVARVRRLGPQRRQERTALVASQFDFGRIQPRLVTLNPTAAAIWERCNGRRTVSDIVAQVAETGSADVARVQEQVLTFLSGAHAQGIVNLDFPRPPAEGYPAFIRRELEQGALQGLVRDGGAAAEIVRLLDQNARVR